MVEINTRLTRVQVEQIKRMHTHYPKPFDGPLLIEAAITVGPIRAGTRAWLRSWAGREHDWHQAVPFEAWGASVPVEHVRVVEASAAGVTNTPYREWCRARRLVVMCQRCGHNLVTSRARRCPRSAEGLPRGLADPAAPEDLDFALRRQAWVKATQPPTPPVFACIFGDDRTLLWGFRDLAEAEAAAVPFQFDFKMVHLAALHDTWSVRAWWTQDPLDGGPHPLGLGARRLWPLPRRAPAGPEAHQ